MRHRKRYAIFALMSVSACGGGDMLAVTQAGGPQAGGPSGPIFPISTPSITELDGQYSWNRSIATNFDVANLTALEAPTDASATYKGGFQVSVGSTEEYLSGDLNVAFNFVSGFGTGGVDTLNISGNDVQNRLLSVFDVLNVSIPTVSGTSFNGTISGQYRDQAQVGGGSADYTVDTTVDGRFVAGQTFPSIIGVVDGTLADPDRGAVPVFGVIAAEKSLF